MKIEPINNRYSTEIIGRNVTTVREKDGRSRYALARDCGIHDETLRDLENGKFIPKVTTLLAIADELGVDISVFLKGVRT